MTFDLGHTRPPCASPKCENSAIIMVGRKFYCGECAVKVQEIMKEREESFIQEKLQNASP